MPIVVLNGDCMMDVVGTEGFVTWSSKDTVSRKVTIRMVVTVASGRIMMFKDCRLVRRYLLTEETRIYLPVCMGGVWRSFLLGW
jgi:hypothetical protein